MMDDKLRREHIRWLIILTLQHARPMGHFDRPILTVVQSEFPDATALELRRELDYLEKRQVVRIQRQPDNRWHCELTQTGIDVAEYTVDCHAGIARPEKYW